VMGARTGGAEFGTALLLSLPYIFAGAAASLLTHVPDIEGDRQSGATTFASKYGLRATAMTALGMVALAWISALWFHDFIMLVAALVALPVFIRFYRKRSAEAAQTAVKTAVFSLAFAVGLTWIPFLALMALYYPLARWYHRERLGLDYPSFRSTLKHPAAPAATASDFSGNLAVCDHLSRTPLP